MKLEYLYPELGNLYGDGANMRYLRKCIPEAEYIETPLNTEPAFAGDGDVRFVYCGPMTERGQRMALPALRAYARALEERIDDGCCFLFTGNSMELVGQSIRTAEDTLTGRGLFELEARQDLNKRYNGFFLGKCDELEITAFNSRFSHCHPGTGVEGFAAVKRGIGLEEGCAFEGIRRKNFLGTYLLGPLLVLNPLLTQQLLSILGAETQEPLFFSEAMEAYTQRKAEFSNRRKKLD